jgi:hypothetical protein
MKTSPIVACLLLVPAICSAQALSPVPPVYFFYGGPQSVPFVTQGTGQASRITHIKSPSPGMTFTEGLPIRVLGDAWDLTANWVWVNDEVLTFDGTPVCDMSNPSAAGQNDFHECWLTDVQVGAHIAPGRHTLQVRRADGGSPSWPVWITVEPTPQRSSTATFDNVQNNGQNLSWSNTTLTLTSDVVLSAAQNLSLANVTLVGNGHTILTDSSNPTWTGTLTINNSRITGLGSHDIGQVFFGTNSWHLNPGAIVPSFNVETSASIDIENSVFEYSGEIDLRGHTSMRIINNEFRANNRILLYSSLPELAPLMRIAGAVSGSKLFQGNRIGSGYLSIEASNGWTIGADAAATGATADAQGNILIGPRVELVVHNCQNTVIRRNYSDDRFHAGWSQGYNFVFEAGTNASLVEHNLIMGGSWPIQGANGEVRYNLLVERGHDWIRGVAAGTKIHHNVFTHALMSFNGGAGDPDSTIWVAGDGNDAVEIYNNTIDGGNDILTMGGHAIRVTGASGLSGGVVGSLRNNAFAFQSAYRGNTPESMRIVVVNEDNSGAHINRADYNLFGNVQWPQVAGDTVQNYSGVVPGGHDVGSDAVQVDPLFVSGRALPYPIREENIWNRAVVAPDATPESRIYRLAQVLAYYRGRYMPAAMSPLIDAGDPQDTDAHGRRADIGAIDRAGHDKDGFGLIDDEIFADGLEGR